MPASNNYHNHDGHSTNNDENIVDVDVDIDVDVESTSTSRVRVIPGSSLLSLLTTKPPPPPTSPPPKPSHLCKIAVVGDAYSGKTSFIQKFIHRRYADGGEEKICSNNNGGGMHHYHYTTASATSNSIGTSLGEAHSSYDGLGSMESTSSLAEYHKKDVTIYWNGQNNNIIDDNTDHQAQQQQKPYESAQRKDDESKKILERNKPVCIRVQLWDMNIHHYFTTQQKHENDEPDSNNSVHSETSSCHSLAKRSYFATLLPLLKRIHGVIIVCRCPLPPSSSSSSIPMPHLPNNNASYASNYYDATSCSSEQWPEFEAVKQQIQRWTSFIHDQLLNGSSNSNHQNQQQHQQKQQQQSPPRPIVFVSLSCADLVVARYSPREWVELTSRMQGICKECGVDSWSMNSCMDSIGSGSSSTDDEKSDSREKQQQQQSALLQRLLQQQKRMLEDMEDATEAALIDMISMHLR
mmetsp:Transcript_16561/g.31179  ORF Transcript_16561/g.31179 Transcript_16561/m.31179 type:complete len:465 (+) Transcript_16561:168-1562(+)